MNNRLPFGTAALAASAPMRAPFHLTKRYLLAAVCGAAALSAGVALINTQLPAAVHAPHVVQLGDYGYGTPLAHEETECESHGVVAEIILNTATDTWTCESDG